MILNLFAKFLAWAPVRTRIIAYAQKYPVPMSHIASADGSEIYMYRYWIFNPYKIADAKELKPFSFLPSIRLHKIMRPDYDRDYHDHPWDARTFILQGFYIEERLVPGRINPNVMVRMVRLRSEGNSASIKFEEYHKIAAVPEEGVWTIFVTWKLKGMWGFLVNGKKVPFWQYKRNGGKVGDT